MAMANRQGEAHLNFIQRLRPRPRRRIDYSNMISKSRTRPRAGQCRYWPADKIEDETDSKYLIHWSKNEKTGQTYLPSWEPKHFANALLVQAWEVRVAERQSENDESATSGPQSESLLLPVVTDNGDDNIIPCEASNVDFSPYEKGNDGQHGRARDRSRMRCCVIL